MADVLMDEVAALDIDRPSLQALAYSLRHPETWPSDFVWDYSECARCAMGLAYQLWFKNGRPRDSREWLSLMAIKFAMPYEATIQVFVKTRAPRTLYRLFPTQEDVTPEQVAAAIDRYVTRQS